MLVSSISLLLRMISLFPLYEGGIDVFPFQDACQKVLTILVSLISLHLLIFEFV